MLQFDQRRFFYPDPDDRPAVCRVRVYRNAGRYIVIASELHDNPGTSINAAAASLAAEVCQQFELPISESGFIEHCPTRRTDWGEWLDETFDLVTFEPAAVGTGRRFAEPQWRRLTCAQVEALIGEPWAVAPAPAD